MRIKVKASSNQIYYEYEGEVVQWGQTVEGFSAMDHVTGKSTHQYMQVPCVLLRDGGRIQIVPLARQAYQYDIEVLDEPQDRIRG